VGVSEIVLQVKYIVKYLHCYLYLLMHKLKSIFIKNAFLLLGAMIAFAVIFAGAYVVTGDGACHLYNAKLINAMLFKDSADYYKTFFTFNKQISPNCTGHLLLVIFQFFFSAAIAEKLFFISYILITITGWYKLLKFSVNGNRHFISKVFLITV
jgi:hypothetical protein